MGFTGGWSHRPLTIVDAHLVQVLISTTDRPLNQPWMTEDEEKQKHIQKGDSSWPFDSLVGGHQQPSERVTWTHHPKRVTQKNQVLFFLSDECIHQPTINYIQNMSRCRNKQQVKLKHLEARHYPRLPNTFRGGIWIPKHLFTRFLGVPNTSSPGTWRILDG